MPLLGFFSFINQVDVGAGLYLIYTCPGWRMTFLFLAILVNLASFPYFFIQGVERVDHGPGPLGTQISQTRILTSALVPGL